MRIFVTAVAGTAMGSLAGLLKELGHDVAGSDVAFHPPMGPALKEWGVRLFDGFSPTHLEGEAFDGEKPELVVVGNVCRKDNPEAVAAEKLGIERLHVADALKRFALPGTSPLVVAGTHGKTTTSSLCAHLLSETGRGPGFLIGGVPTSMGRSFRAASGKNDSSPSSEPSLRNTPFVLEGDEYDTAFWEKTAKFLHYQAEVAIITSIEHDHIDIYPTLESYISAFKEFVQTLPPSGLLLAYAGDPLVVQVASLASCKVSYYSLEGEDSHGVTPRFIARATGEGPKGTSFDLHLDGELAGSFVSPLCGAHNLRNVCAAFGAVAQGYGVELQALLKPLASFGGIKRRQELRGVPGGVHIYDDFAHHPTAVKETLAGLRSRHPDGRMIAIFEPRSATACRRIHQEAYENAFDSATHVIFAPVGRKELSPSEILDVPALVSALKQRKTPTAQLQASHFSDLSSIIEQAVSLARSGDTIAVLSNGAFGGIHEKLLEAIEASLPSSKSGEQHL